MAESKIIGYATKDVIENNINIVIDDENFIDTLPEFSDFDRVIMGYMSGSEAEEKHLKKLYGENIQEVDLFNLISIVDNVVTVQSPENKSPKKIYHIYPYYPEYDDLSDEKKFPGWAIALEKLDK